MKTELRILIVGGYGIFGGRLVELLEDDARLTLIVGGRSLRRATEYCASRARAVARLIPVRFDRSNDDLQQLSSLNPTVVVDASGPFQDYGSHPYRLIEQCIACKINYLDLADGSNFVAGMAQFDAAAKATGVYVLSGVSSFPVLTAAVVRELEKGFSRIDAIRGGIAPSPYAGVGVNVIRAIANYSGQSIFLRRNGTDSIGYPFAESMQFVIAVPGHVPLKARRFSLVDVPDLRTLSTMWPQVESVWMGAAPVPAILHRALNAFAWLVRLRLLKTIAWMAGMMHFVTNHVRWGEHRGGMFVEVRGENLTYGPVTREWHMLAEGSDGPLIPCMAVEAIIRRSLEGNAPTAGARTAISDVNLSDYENLFSRRAIYSGFREKIQKFPMPLYQRVLGDAWNKLAPEIRALHSVTGESHFAGQCTVDRGRNPLAWLMATLIGFPKRGRELSITVALISHNSGERWVRTCDGHTFSSVQHAGNRSSQWLIIERFGPISVYMALVVVGENLHYIIRRWRFLRIPLPLSWGPRSAAVESVENGRFRFDVEITHPLAGLVVRYRGTLVARSIDSNVADVRLRK